MKILQTDFAKELSDLLIKHGKTFESDKGGIYAVDSDNETVVFIAQGESGSEDWRGKLLFVKTIQP